MKKTLLLVILLNTTLFACSQKSKTNIVETAVKNLIADKDMKNAHFGFLAINAKTGKIIAEHNSNLGLMPASTLKLITTATALEVLGSKYTFKTRLQYSGSIDTATHTLNGNLYISGGSDPTLGSKYYDKQKKYDFINRWINTLQQHKIETINGAIIADASRYSTETAPPKWAWEDVGNYYGAGANGLTAFDNLYEIHFKSPALPDKATTLIKTEPVIPNLKIINEVVSSNSRRDEAFVFAAPYSYLHIIRGNIPKAKEKFTIKGAIPDPALYLAQYLRKKMAEQSISCTENPTTVRLLKLKGKFKDEKRHTLHTNYSPNISSIINITNKKSINLFAEHFLNEIGYKLKQEGSNNVGRQAIMDFWKTKGMDTDGMHIHDGSGLSRSDAITAKQLVFMLRYMQKSKNYKVFYNSLPVAGKSGTLKYVGRKTSAAGAIHAKSGSIGLVRAYAGYVSTKAGQELIFSMNIANYNCSSYSARKKLTALMIAMADYQ